MKLLKINMRILSLIIICHCFIVSNGEEINTRKVKETVLSKIGLHEMYNSSYTISKNARSIAFVIRKDNKSMAVMNDLKGKPFDEINALVFSPDGNRFAYAARDGKNWLVVADNKTVVVLDSGITIPFIRFSPDSKKLLYILNKLEQKYIVYDGKKNKSYDLLNENTIVFNNNGSKIAYIAGTKKQQFIVYDQKEGLPFDMVGMPVLNPVTNQLVYMGVSGKQSFIVTDNIKSKPYDAIGNIKFTPDGKHIIYDVQRNGKHFVILDNKENEMHEYIHSYELSNDGSRLAYGIVDPVGDKDGNKEYAMVDGKKEGPFEQIMTNSFQFSPDSKELIYAVQLPGHLTDEEALLRPEEAYEWFIVRNGKHQPHYNMLQGSMVFSSNSKRFAYAAEKYIKRVVNVDGVEEAAFDDIFYIAFSPDSKKLAYTAKENNKEFVVVNSTKGKMYEEIMGGKEIVFDDDNSFHYLVKKGDEIYLIEETIE